MIRRLMIPVGGTIAALVAIVLAHEPRPKPAFPPMHQQDPYEHVKEHAEEFHEEVEPPQTFRLELQADGSFVNLDSKTTYSSSVDVAEQLGGARHTLVLSPGKDVTDAALEEMKKKLETSDRFEVRTTKPAPTPETHDPAPPKGD